MPGIFGEWVTVTTRIRYKRNRGWSTYRTLYPMIYDAAYLRKRLGDDTYALGLITGDIVPYRQPSPYPGA